MNTTEAVRCPGSRSSFYDDADEVERNGKTIRRKGICAFCHKRVSLDPKGARGYPLKWVLKTHYDGRR